MANFLMNIAGVITAISVPLAGLAKQQTGATTSFSLILGMSLTEDFNAGGSIPHLAFWDILGNRIAQYKGNANGHLAAGDDWEMTINNDQTTPKGSQAEPEYVSVVAQEKDAICISAVMASGNGGQYAWYGDMGYTCGADWHYSNRTVGDGHYQPYCVWIDPGNTKGIRFQGFSLHLPDFTVSQTGPSQEFSASLDPLCKSDPRMKFWPKITPDAIIPFFKPPLKYNLDGSDVDLSKVINKPKRRSTQSYPRPGIGGRQLHPDHLIVSKFETHSAKQLCESDTSIGPDFVSTNENLFCDMATKELWPLCSSTLTTGCFDVQEMNMVGDAPGSTGPQPAIRRDPHSGRAIPVKSYKRSHMWG